MDHFPAYKTEHLVLHWNLIHRKWMQEDAFFDKDDAIQKMGSLCKEFPHERFRIFTCEPLEQQS